MNGTINVKNSLMYAIEIDQKEFVYFFFLTKRVGLKCYKCYIIKFLFCEM